MLFRPSTFRQLLLLLIISLGFGLRIHQLDGQSMWSDEGLSLYRAGQPPAAVLSNIITVDGVDTNDTNPPLYFLLLHFWRSAVGDHAAALRFLGAALATLAVPLMYVLGTAVFGSSVGVMAALLTAVSPLHVWQSPIIRNYGLLLTLNLLSVYGLVRFVLAGKRDGRWPWLILWAAAGFLGILTHYFAFFVLAFGLVTLLIDAIQQMATQPHSRRLLANRRLWLGLGALALLTLPVIWVAYNRFRAGQQVDFYYTPVKDILAHALSAFSSGEVFGILHPWWRTAPVLMLAILGLIWGWFIRRAGVLLLLGYQIIPLGLLILLSTINPLYNGVRHLLIGLPPFLILCASGVVGGWTAQNHPRLQNQPLARLARWSGLLLGLLVVGLQADWLHTQFTDSHMRIDDVRGAALYLNEVAQPGDVIILHDTLIGFTFDFYYDGAAPWQAIPQFGQRDVAEVTAVFEQTGAAARRIWFLNAPAPRNGFPADALPDWAAEHWVELGIFTFPSLWLKTELTAYLPDPVYPALPDTAVPTTAVFTNGLQLAGTEWPNSAKAGSPWWLSSYWRPTEQTSDAYTLSLRLLDADGRLWQQIDQDLWQQPPPAVMSANSLLRTDHEIRWQTGLPTGDYTLWLRMLDQDGRPLSTTGGEIDILLGHIAMKSGSDPAQLPPHTPQNATMGPLSLLGYHLPDSEIRPGHLTPVDLFWRVRQTPPDGLRLRIELLAPSGQLVTTTELPLTQANYPGSAWQPGEILQSKAEFVLPATAVAEPHTLRLSLLNADGSVSRTITLNTPLSVAAWPLISELPPFSQAVNAAFGNPAEITLQGVDLPQTSIQPGQTLPLTLIWQAVAVPGTNYAIFVHIADAQGQIVAQRDGLPMQGFRPTISWRAGEVIIDPQDVAIGADVPPGDYTVWVGLYDPDTFVRPFTVWNGQELPDGRVPVGQITVKEQP